MREFNYSIVDVFTKTQLQGNPLAVFASADGLSDVEMQSLARELNLSETAFLQESATPDAVAKLRIFTPRRELDFAGHPTIGSAYILTATDRSRRHFSIESNVGLVEIDVDRDSDGDPVFWLTTPKLTYFETVDPAFCARLLNLPETDIAADIRPQFVSAGSPLLFICLNSPEAVDRAELQEAHVREALGSANSVGTFIFARKEPQSASCFDVYSRMFAPQTGIPEDPATGGATGPLAGYMLRVGLLPRSSTRFTSEQGVRMGRRSILHVRLGVDDDVSIKVGGSVVPVAQGTFSLGT